MEMRQVPVPPDVQYVLDSAIENQEINGLDHCVLTLYADRTRLMEIVDAPYEKGRGWINGRGLMCRRLDAYAHELAGELPQAEQRAFVAIALTGEPKRLADIAEVLASWNLEDATRGGVLEPFRKVLRCDANCDPTPRARRRLHGRNAIRRYVSRCDESLPHMRALAAGVRRLPWPASLDEGRRIVEAYDRYFAACRTRYEEAVRRSHVRLSAAPVIAAKDRKVIRRSAALAATIVGEREVASFIKGAPVRIEGEGLDIEAARAGSLAASGHGSLRLKLLDKSGAELGRLCAYFEGMPALDQLAGIKLHLASGNERAVLDTGNLYALTPAGAAHPLIAARATKPVPARGGARAPRGNYDALRAAVTRYQAATLPLYVEAVTDAVWGRDAKRLKRLTRGSAGILPALANGAAP